jgi:hypothetical protein
MKRCLETPEFGVVVFSLLLNFPWEMWQIPFFLGMAQQSHWAGVKACSQATFGDAAIALMAFLMTAWLAGSRNWILAPAKWQVLIYIGIGIVTTIAFEDMATRRDGRWIYAESMPRLPIFGTGLLPLLQWLIIPLLVIWFVRRQIDSGRPAPSASGTHNSINKSGGKG